MALVRCLRHLPAGQRGYRKAPLGPVAGLVCGFRGCGELGLVWLTPEEHRAYSQGGQRTFAVTGRVKVTVG